MAKKTDETNARLLSKLLPGMQVTSDGDPNTPLEFDGQNSWTVGEVNIDGTAYYVLMTNGYWDLSGYSLQDKTLFATGFMAQYIPTVFGSFNGFVSRIVSTEPLPMAAFEVTAPSRTWALPGHSGSSFSMQQIFYGDCTLWTTDSTVNTVVPVTSSNWGTGSSTAREKLYMAVAICFPKTLTQQLIFPDTNFVLPTIVGKEDELEYMMRLARSVETI